MATVNASEYVLDLERLAEQLGNYRSVHETTIFGQRCQFKMRFTVPEATADGTDALLRLVTFPHGTFLDDFSAVVSDMDTHATPEMDLRFVMLDSADAEQFDVTDESTAGQGGGGVERAAGVPGRYVGGLTLALKINTAAATAAAGTADCYFPVVFGVACEDFDVPHFRAFP